MAFVFYEQALKKAGDAADMEIIGRTRIEMGNAYNNISEYDNARDQYHQAITILKALGNHNELARAYNNLGDCYIKTGDLEEAIEVLRQCMDLATSIGDDTIKGWAAFNAAECFTKMGETEIAKQYLDIALELLEKSDDKIGVVYTLQVYGQTFMAEKEYDLAEDSFNKSISLVKELGMKALEGEVLRVYASMLIDKGDRKGAVEVLKRALGAFDVVNREKEAKEVRELLNRMM
jgi:tetratricopeptide (TPR) repeat protein